MWQCAKCREQHEDSFRVCWNCGTSSDGIEDPHFHGDGSRQEADALKETITAASPSVTVSRPSPAFSVEQLIFVGLNGYAVALDRDTGSIVWSNKEMKSGHVTMLLDGDRLIVSSDGYIYCLEPLTGKIRWHNPLKGYGFATPAALLSVRGQSSQTASQQAAIQASTGSDAVPVILTLP
jgi:outer membrane protein assembly factor BamB